jgi:hypothetical protein
MAGKYTPLQHYIKALPQNKRDITLSYVQIERILNDKLPLSATQHRPWWSNEIEGSHVQARAWLDAGWKVDTVDSRQKWVRFIRQK